MTTPTPPRTPRRRRLGCLPGWRIFSYVILIFNIVMLAWVIGGAASNSHTADCAGTNGQAAQAGCQIGTGIAIVALILFWALGDVILGVLWLVTRPRGHDCPVCGERVKRSVFVCRRCGYDFRALLAPDTGARVPAPPAAPPAKSL